MITYSGKVIDLANLKVEDIDDLDIAVSLSRINRCVGHTAFPYSVAQHALFVCSLVMPGKHDSWNPSFRYHVNITNKNIKYYQLLALSHDNDEYITNDIPQPVKILLKPAITEIENPIMQLMYAHYKIAPPTQEDLNYIKSLDIEAFEVEHQMLRKQAYVELENPFYSHSLNTLQANVDPNLIALTFLRKLKELGV